MTPTPAAAWSRRIELGVPAQVAFDFLADPTTAPIIDPAVREYRPDTVPMAEGTRNVIRVRLFGVPMRAESIVTTWQPPHRMEMESIKPSRPVRAIATHSFTPNQSGCTYEWAMALFGNAPLGTTTARFLARLMERNARRQQIRLRDELRRRSSTQATEE